MRSYSERRYYSSVWHGCIALCLVGVIALTGCSRLNKLLGKTTAPKLSVLRFGLAGDGANPISPAERDQVNGATLAIETINAAGGVVWRGTHYTMALKASDGPDSAMNLARLAASAPVALLSPTLSAPTLRALPEVASSQTPVFTVATDPALTNSLVDHQARNIFRLRPSEVLYARSVADYVAHLPGKVALATLDAPYGQRGAALLNAAFAAARHSPGAQILLPPGLDDGASQASQIIAANATAVICWSTPLEAVALLQALRAANWSGTFIVGMLDDDFIALAGPSGDGAIGAVSWGVTPNAAVSRSFSAAYQRRFGAPPDEDAAMAYDAVMLTAQGIAAVGPDPHALDAYLLTVKQAGAAGMYDPQATGSLTGALGDMRADVALVRVAQGQTLPLAQP